MKEFLAKNKWITLLLIIGAVFFFLTYVAPLLTPILLAFVVVALFGPLLKRLQVRLHIRRQVGIVILLILAGFFIGIIGWLVISWAVKNAPGWGDYLAVWEVQLERTVHDVFGWLGDTFGVDVSDLEDSVAKLSGALLGKMQSDVLPNMLNNILRSMKGLATGGAFLLTFFIGTILLAKDYDEYMNLLLEHRECYVWLRALCGTLRYIVSFIKAQLIIMGTIAAVIALVLFCIRIPNGLLWGLLAGALDILPFVGTGIVLLPLILIQLARGAYWKALVCGLLYGGCVLIREFLEPRILGKTMGIWPVAVLTSIYAGIRLFGVAGVIKGPLGFVLIYQIYQSIMNVPTTEGGLENTLSRKNGL